MIVIETMFLLARLYQNLDRNKEANSIFDKIIAQHPQSNYAKRSRQARGRIDKFNKKFGLKQEG